MAQDLVVGGDTYTGVERVAATNTDGEVIVYPEGGDTASNAVQYVPQKLDEAEQTQARRNINAMGCDDIYFRHNAYNYNGDTEHITTVTINVKKIVDGKEVVESVEINNTTLYEHAKLHGYEGEIAEFYDTLARNMKTLKGDGLELDPNENILYITSGGKRIGTGVGMAAPDVVQYVEQDLTDQQKAQARKNIGALAANDANGVLQQAKASSDAAKQSENNAKTSEGAAKTAETNAGNSASAASQSAQNAKQSETTASAKASESTQAATNAKTSETNAKASETAAANSAAEAKQAAEGIKSLGQPDHAENDSTKHSHILNRTHWKEVEPMVSLFNRSDVGATYVQADRIGLEVGETYEVYCDGNFYDAVGTAYAADGETGVTLKTAEGRDPGCIIIDFSPETAVKNGYGLRITTSGSQYSTITITGSRITWHKMERGYLPDELGNVKTVNDQLPDQYGNVQVDVGVKTVNGQSPDASGNVNVSGGSGGGAQADLAENDPNAAGYVKNRTHWKEVVGFAGEVIPNKTLLFFGTSTTMATGFNHIIAAGEKYLVTWNGTVYECVGKEHNGIVYLGNLSFKESGEEASDYPFCIYYSDKKYVFLDGQTSGTRAVVVKVEGNPDVIWHKLDKEYLPDDLGGVKTVNGKSPDENGNVEVEGVTDYNKLENTPCGVEMVELLPETTAELDPESYEGLIPAAIALVDGNTYTVIWNGVSYTSKCQLVYQNGMRGYLLGDGAMLGVEGKGEPFVLISVPEASVTLFMVLDGSTSATLSITGEGVKKLDTKFLPKMVVTFTRFADVTDVYMRADKSIEQIVAAIHDGMIVEGRYIENGTLFIFHVAKAPVSVESVENLDGDCLVFSSVYGITPTIIAYKRLSGNLEVFEIDPVTP